MELELLAPARNAEIGIAAIDCGADAVYIAGPAFGARQAAGNPVEDIEKLCRYAHRFGARVFITFNTIIYDSEIAEAEKLLLALRDAGADALIVQDLAVVDMARSLGLGIPLHASTQCAIRTPQQAKMYESLGFSRLVLERQLSLDEIKAISKAVTCELEFFIHGALCVSYSGNCYLSQALAGRSANRGACIQACRSRYDLVDASGKVLVRDKALLSLKDYNLKDRIKELAEAGICSLKIEGRLKNISYVRNVVREYSLAMKDWGRTSYGQVAKGFEPASDKTFNRGYTSLYIDGKRGRWASMDAPGSMGEKVGTVTQVLPEGFRLNLEEGVQLVNGDGFAFATKDGVTGFRGDICTGNKVRCKPVRGLHRGVVIYRNISRGFERYLAANPCHREIGVVLEVTVLHQDGIFNLVTRAYTEDGRKTEYTSGPYAETAKDRDRMESVVRSGLNKSSGIYGFVVSDILSDDNMLPLLTMAAINSIRRGVAEQLDTIPCNSKPLMNRPLQPLDPKGIKATYKNNVANSIASRLFTEVQPAYELSPAPDAELMRSRYCIRYELGMCHKHHRDRTPDPLFLVNNGRRLPLLFDCKKCEMAVLYPVNTP
ncbi:MAG: U32 family peptidase [Bacteroidales bacterium]|nr:U32 family peptidase [Bacteroidales bacterium]